MALVRDVVCGSRARPAGSGTAVGVLDDAMPMAGAVPTAMLFTSSTRGISHAREEDTPEEHLRLGVEAFYRAVCRVIAAD